MVQHPQAAPEAHALEETHHKLTADTSYVLFPSKSSWVKLYSWHHTQNGHISQMSDIWLTGDPVNRTALSSITTNGKQIDVVKNRADFRS